MLEAKDAEIAALTKANGLLKTHAETAWARGRDTGAASNAAAVIDADKARRSEHADRLADNVRLTEALDQAENKIAALRQAGQKPKTCTWQADVYGSWHRGCNNSLEFTQGDLLENGLKFCSYCGGRVVAAMAQPVQPALSMSMFASKADYDEAQKVQS